MTTLVLKVGGNELDDPAFVAAFAAAVALLRPVPVLVHGGGKEIGIIQKALGGEPRFVAGLRVTDAEALQAAEMVLCGSVSTRLVAALQAAGAEAQGLSGVDRGLIRVEQWQHPDGDLGRVGRPIAVRGALLRNLLAEGVVPVVAPISLGPEGSYNVNADEAAGAIAAAIAAADAAPAAHDDDEAEPEVVPAVEADSEPAVETPAEPPAETAAQGDGTDPAD
ncbi:MAG TPA: hypothetical protein PKC19_11775, partial [Roseiflexaceae bacterium]|nr:hypothetical protein [Roseiflexaceae bacterium]